MIELDAVRRADGVLRRLQREIDNIKKSISDISRNQAILSDPLKLYYQTATEQQVHYNLMGTISAEAPMDPEKAKELIATKTERVNQYSQLHSAIRSTLDSLMNQKPGIYREVLSDRLAACIEEAEFVLSEK